MIDGRIVPDWLGPVDHPWLRELCDRLEAAVGLPRRELDRRLALPLSRTADPRRARMATHVLLGWLAGGAQPSCHPSPSAAREAVYLRSSSARATGWGRDRVVREVADQLGVTVAALEHALVADLPAEQAVRLTESVPDPGALAVRTNLALAQALVKRALTLRIRVFGGSRDLVRHLRLQGLLCVVRDRSDGVELEVSGPFALFRRTTLYGRAYASIVPRLPWCDRFALTAACRVRGIEAILELRPSDPLFPSAPPRRFDSKLEQAFAVDLARRFPDWDAVREPEPIAIDGVLMFPDFAVFRRADPSVRWLVEIVGFWTPEYLASKLDRLARVAGAGWVVCVDQDLNCAVDALPLDVPVVRFRRRIDVAEVLARLQVPAAAPSSRPASPSAGSEAASEMARVVLSPRSYFLDWAGRRPATDPVHVRLRDLAPGERVELVVRDGWCLVVGRGGPIAALSAAAREEWMPRLPRIREVTVRRMVTRTRDQSGPAYRRHLRTEQWAVPMIEVAWSR
ncbi:MAG: DUF790 family protein [Myxococcota bacterium]